MTTTRVSPRWEDPRAVSGFVTSTPNPQLLAFAEAERSRVPQPRALDIGCGAARNALPLAALGYHVTGTDLSLPMLDAARARTSHEAPHATVSWMHAPMAPLPFADASFDLVVAHGIWNLARSGDEFHAAIAEAARVAAPDAGLFVFTFSRHTLAADATPDPGESFVFSSWNGDPCCFLTEQELVDALARVGFARASDGPLTEYNRPGPNAVRAAGPPVIYEGVFRRR